MLPDKLFFWPYEGDSLQPAIDELTPVLLKSGLSKYVACKEGNLAEYIALECRFWNINPWALMIAAQTEQSALTTPDLSDKALVAWLGVVGQDVGRTTNPGFLGIYMQVQRACEVMAWLLGVETPYKWPTYLSSRKQAPRYLLGRKLQVEGAPTMVAGKLTPGKEGVIVDYMPVSAGQYMLLAYTPHWKVLAAKEAAANKFVPLKYLS